MKKIEDIARRYYDNSSESKKKIIRGVYNKLRRLPFTPLYQNNKWAKIAKIYTKFGREQREQIFLSIARFCNINRPINGYYFEFGCNEANTMRMAYRNFHYLFDWTYVGFDSFDGLPEIQEIDKQRIWKKGKLKTSEDDFIRIVTRGGMPRKKLITIKGFYDQSLNSEVKEKLLPVKAAVIYVDCDLYVSTIPVLNFSKDFLQKGTIIVFDDWFCFYGDPNKGERRAFREFRERNPRLIFEDFIQTNEAKAFIYLGEG
jgi:hypothetical protein